MPESLIRRYTKENSEASHRETWGTRGARSRRDRQHRKRPCSRSRNKIRAADSPLFPRGRISCRNETRDPFIPAHTGARAQDNCAYRAALPRERRRRLRSAPLRENNVIKRCTIARGQIIEKARFLGGVCSRGNLRSGGPKSNLRKRNHGICARGGKGDREFHRPVSIKGGRWGENEN